MINSKLLQGFLPRTFLALTFLAASIMQTATADELFTIAGTGEDGLSGDGGPANVAQLNQPHSIAADSVGNIYIADFENSVIRKINSGGTISIFAGTGTAGFSGDTGLAVDADLNRPISVAVDGSNNVYVLDFDNRRIRMIDTAGIITTIAGDGFNGSTGDGGLATAARFNQPWAIDVDALGNVFIADRSNHRIRRIDALTNIITTVAGTGTAGYDALQDGGPAISADLNSPHGLVVDAVGNIYIADTFNQRVRMVDTLGVITTVAGEGLVGDRDSVDALLGRFRQPRGIDINAAGEIFIADFNNHRIRKVDTGGALSTIAGTGVADFNGDGRAAVISELNGPMDVFVDAAGDVVIADMANSRVRIITADTPNDAPTDITLSNSTALGSDGADAPVGTLTTDDINAANVHVYSLTAGTGDTDNSLFDITGDQLTVVDATPLSGTYSIRILTDDQVDASFVEAFTVTVTDDVPPVIALTGADPQMIDQGMAYSELGATASDNVDGVIDPATITIDASAVDTATPGDYVVTYDVNDATGNPAATVSRTVTVTADTTAPVITLTGSDPQVLAFGATYAELGATAVDDVDGDISAMVVIDATAVDTAAAGNYTVTYDVSDAAGNPATAVTRTVTVQAAPVIPPPTGRSSGGGCTVGPSDGTIDPTLPLLVLFSLVYLFRRRAIEI